MRRQDWDRRYAEKGELLWGAGPNRFVEERLADARPEPGARALDLACGEGRNAVWLARRGWNVTAVDFSHVALERGRAAGRAAGVEDRLEWVEADLAAWEPPPGAFALVVVAYLHVPSARRPRTWALVARALAPGGRLVAVGHALANLAEGTGGPSDPDVLWEPAALAAELAAAGLRVDVCEHVRRPVEDAPRDAIDTLVEAREARDARR